MFLPKSLRFMSITVITTTVLLMAGCGGGGDGGTNFPTPTLPADAVEFNTSNAKAIADAAMDSGDSLGIATGARNTESQISIQDAIDTVTRLADLKARQSRAVVTGATGSEPIFCDSGSGNLTYNISGNDVSGSATITITFLLCELSGLVINGSFSFSSSWRDTWIYTNTGGGVLDFTFGTESFAIVMYFDEEVDTSFGNITSGDFTYSQNFSVTGLPEGNFLVETTVPFMGNYWNGTIDSGELIVSGGNNTRIRITVGPTNWVTVELDDGLGGGFVEITESPFEIFP